MSAPSAAAVPPYVAAVRLLRRRLPVGRGGGVLIDPRHVLTCAHVVADTNADNARLPLRRSFDEPVASGWPQARSEGFSIRVLTGCRRSWDEDWRGAEYLDEDLDNDLALLKLDRPAHGAVAPLIRPGRPDGASLAAFSAQAERFERHDLGPVSQARRTVEGGLAPHAVSHDHGLPAGYSGGPMIAADAEGRHWLDGICTLGGIGSPIGATAGLGAVLEFLERTLGWRPEAAPDAAPAAPPGVAARFALEGEGAATLRFRWWRTEGGPLFRATRPLSAAAQGRLRNGVDRPGGDRLPAHLPDVAAARACLEALEGLHGPGLRLPTRRELDEMARADEAAGTASPAVPAGVLPVLSAYYDETRLAPPVGTAEWGQEDGIPRLFVRRRAGEPMTPLPDAPAGSGEMPHLRHTLRPLFRPS